MSDDELARVDDAYAKARRPRWIAQIAAVLLLGAVGVFVATDPLGVMPGIVESFDRAASEMYPSRQVAEKGSASDSAPETGETGAGEADGAHVLSEPEAFQLLSAVYAEITSYQDALGPVIETFNGQYLIKDFDQRSQASQGAYDLRSTIQQTLDELDSLRLTENTAYAEDVEHLKQLATWMYNRVDVLCKTSSRTSISARRLPKARMTCVLPSSRPWMSSTPCALPRTRLMPRTSSILSSLPHGCTTASTSCVNRGTSRSRFRRESVRPTIRTRSSRLCARCPWSRAAPSTSSSTRRTSPRGNPSHQGLRSALAGFPRRV